MGAAALNEDREDRLEYLSGFGKPPSGLYVPLSQGPPSVLPEWDCCSSLLLTFKVQPVARHTTVDGTWGSDLRFQIK